MPRSAANKVPLPPILSYYINMMIQDPLTMTALEKLVLIGEVFLKIAGNFWWVILLGIISAIIIHTQESTSRR
jgi:hypothetical protein